MSSNANRQVFDLTYVGERRTPDSWLVYDRSAEQTKNMSWSTKNVTAPESGGMEIKLGAAPAGARTPYVGGGVQSAEALTTGTFSWTAQVPEMQDGAVFAMFAYRDSPGQPWLEYDFEFVGADATQVELSIIMHDARGQKDRLRPDGEKVIVDLGFDASDGMHTYDITVTGSEVIFMVDGDPIGRYGSEHMLGGTWRNGPMRSFTTLWNVDKRLEHWAGDWDFKGKPLVAHIDRIDVRPGDLGQFDPSLDLLIKGDREDNVLVGTAYGETLVGGDGNDTLLGHEGSDTLVLDQGQDILDGGLGQDWAQVEGARSAQIDLAAGAPQDTGLGMATLRNIENASGGSGADVLSGNDLTNSIMGQVGNDSLQGRGGNDTLDGGLGDDVLEGGEGEDRLMGGADSDTILLDAGNDRIDGGDGVDWLAVSGRADTRVNLGTSNGPQHTGFGYDSIENIENISGGDGADSFLGTDSDNVLKGNGGIDILSGRGGSDVLVGGAGRDTLFGGADKIVDRFVFVEVSDSVVGSKRDVVGDFVSSIDKLDLSLIDARPDFNGDQKFAFSGTKAADYSAWFVDKGKDIIVQADIDGNAIADFEIRVGSLQKLSVDDFIL